LGGAKLREADLSHADLSHADLSHSNLKQVNLKEANLSGSKLRKANLIQAKNWTNRQLAQAISLVGAMLPYGKVTTDKDWEKFQKDSSQAGARLETIEDATQENAPQQGRSEDSSHLAAENALFRELVETQRSQLQVLQEELEAKRREIQELHVLLQHSQDQRA
jgi:Pentapeptide repeats (8 copies)